MGATTTGIATAVAPVKDGLAIDIKIKPPITSRKFRAAIEAAEPMTV